VNLRKKVKNKKLLKKAQQRYISRVRGDEMPIVGMMKVGTFFDAPDVINHANFHLHMMNILRASRGQKRGFAFA
jgi:hypothetical protein